MNTDTRPTIQSITGGKTHAAGKRAEWGMTAYCNGRTMRMPAIVDGPVTCSRCQARAKREGVEVAR